MIIIMKAGVSSYSFSKYIKDTKSDYFDVCDRAKEMGFDGIEFIDLNNPGYGITDNPLELAARIREHCGKIGLDIIAYTVGADFLNRNALEERERVCRCVDVAAALGAPLMRHDVCYSLPNAHLYTWKNAVEQMTEHIRYVTDYAGSLGIRTCTENHGRIFQAPERVEQLILAVDSENYGWLCDIGNFLCVDTDPLNAVTVASRYAFHVHAKDFLFKSGSTYIPSGFFDTAGGNRLRGTVLGHGVVPVAQCIGILKSAGYDGWVSLEFEGMEECLPALGAGLKYLKDYCL